VPLVAAAESLPPQVVGIVVAMPGALGIALDIPMAGFVQAFGRQRIIAAGGVLLAAGAILLAVVSSPVGMALGFAFVGAGVGATFLTSLGYLSEIVEDRHLARVQGINGAMQGAGAMIGVFVMGAIAEVLSLRAAFVLPAALGLGLAFYAISIPNRHPGPSASTAVGAQFRQAFQMLARRPPLQISAALTFHSAVVAVAVGAVYVPLFAATKLGLGPGFIGTVLALRLAMAVVMSSLFGAFVARAGLIKPLVATNLLSVASVCLLPLCEEPEQLLAVLMVQGVGISFVAAASNTLASISTTSSERILGLAAVSFVSRVSLLAVPVFLGVVLGLLGFTGMFLVAAALVLLATAFTVDRANRHDWSGALE
jgi:MFS family permease